MAISDGLQQLVWLAGEQALDMAAEFQAYVSTCASPGDRAGLSTRSEGAYPHMR